MKHVRITYAMHDCGVRSETCVTLPIEDGGADALCKLGDGSALYDIILRDVLTELSLLQGRLYAGLLAVEIVGEAGRWKHDEV